MIPPERGKTTQTTIFPAKSRRQIFADCLSDNSFEGSFGVHIITPSSLSPPPPTFGTRFARNELFFSSSLPACRIGMIFRTLNSRILLFSASGEVCLAGPKTPEMEIGVSAVGAFPFRRNAWN